VIVTNRILIVEDNEENRQILRDLLHHAGLDFVEAWGGEAAVAMAKADRPELILMDIGLPGIDGYEATRRIRSDPSSGSVPIIAVTAHSLAGDEAKALEAGCDAYVAKPYSPRQLLKKIREFLPA
jgi:two-component system cell cycle response regulator DivK